MLRLIHDGTDHAGGVRAISFLATFAGFQSRFMELHPHADAHTSAPPLIERQEVLGDL
jgi:hypothetical protein